MVTKNPRQSPDPEDLNPSGEIEAIRQTAFDAHEQEHGSYSQRYGFGWVGNLPSTRGRAIPSANQVAAMKDHPEYEMWSDYRKEKD
ncbi:MAG: hypothetical protein WBW27_27040 [Pseudolabrys sp.]